MMQEVTFKKQFVGNLECGIDLLEALTKLCVENSITNAKIDAIGAVQKGCIGYYDQLKKEYTYIEFDKAMEICCCTGNVSILDGKPMVHAHIVLADRDGRTYGGHLSSGTTVFACEYSIQQFDGKEIIRKYDSQTGLKLWND